MANLRKSEIAVFNKTESFSPRNKREKLLIQAFKTLKTEQDAANFLRDLLTLPEIEEFSNRITIVKMLLERKSYKKIAEEIGASTTTVTRVAHWLYSGCGGYYKVLQNLLKS